MKFCGALPSIGGIRDYDYFSVCGSNNIQLPEKFELPINEWAEVKNQYD